MSRKTIAQVYGMAADLIRTEADTSGIPGLEEDRTIDWCDQLNAEFFDRWKEAGRLPPQYMRKAKGYSAKATTALAADITSTSATSTSVDDASVLFDNSANALVIYGNGSFDVITYTDTETTTDTVTGISGLDFTHSDGDTVHALYPLPSDFGEFRTDKRHKGFTLNGIGGYEQVTEWPVDYQFAMFEDSSENKYLWTPRVITSGDITVFYNAKPTTLTATTSEVDMRSPDYLYVVWGLVGIFKQVLDDSYVPVKEEQMKTLILNRSMSRETVGRRLSAGDAFFDRSYDFEPYPPTWFDYNA